MTRYETADPPDAVTGLHDSDAEVDLAVADTTGANNGENDAPPNEWVETG